MRGKVLYRPARKPDRIVRKDGYVLIWAPDHPRAYQGRVLEHIAVMERTLGRPLVPGKNGEHVHHIDHNPSNNAPENLIVMTAKEHGDMHRDTDVIPGWVKATAARKAKAEARGLVIGQRFGFVTVIDDPGPMRKRVVTYRCDCGTEKLGDLYSLKTGRIMSCGCKKRERLPAMREKIMALRRAAVEARRAVQPAG